MDEIDRRGFTAAALALAAAAPAGAADEKPIDPNAALADLVIARLGKHLDEAGRKALRSRMAGRLGTGDLIRRAMKLTWQDEPATAYHPEGE